MSITDGKDPDVYKKIKELRTFNGQPSEFWNKYLDLLVEVSGSSYGALFVSSDNTDNPWKLLAVWPHTNQSVERASGWRPHIAAICDKSKSAGGVAVYKCGSLTLMGLMIDAGEAHDCLAVLQLEEKKSADLDILSQMLMIISDFPTDYQANRSADAHKNRVELFAGVLDLLVIMNQQKSFKAAAMAMCNELASRIGCERVSLGWLKSGYIKLAAISHVDDFDKKSEAVSQLEAVMEEALDQDTEIVVPIPEGDTSVVRDHLLYVKAQDIENICSVPLRLEGNVQAVLTCERSGREFSAIEQRLLRVTADQTVRRLSDLSYYDKGFFKRAASKMQDIFGKVLGYRHTWAKVIAVAVALFMGIFCFVKVPYRVEAPVIIRTDKVSYITVPFAGHIDQVFVRVGDAVKKGQALLQLDRRDLLLEQASSMAEKNRYDREFEKARAADKLADMRIAKAMRDQASVRLDLVNYRLEQSVIRSLFDGIVVEGDLMERIGAPVQQGDALLTIAQTSDLYAELEVDEADVHHIREAVNGQIALASRPQDIFEIDIVQVEPAAVVRDKGNIFIVRSKFADAESWWRPGMTGIGKINSGKRTLLWIFTHKTVDFLRMRLWW